MKSKEPTQKKDVDTFSLKLNMILDNMCEKYNERLKNLCNRYENEISDIYKLNSISNLSKGKFKNMSMEDFSKISPASKFNRGKEVEINNVWNSRVFW